MVAGWQGVCKLVRYWVIVFMAKYVVVFQMLPFVLALRLKPGLEVTRTVQGSNYGELLRQKVFCRGC